MSNVLKSVHLIFGMTPIIEFEWCPRFSYTELETILFVTTVDVSAYLYCWYHAFPIKDK